MMADINFSRPNEFIAAQSTPDKAVCVKGAKRRGLPREPLTRLVLAGII